MTCSAWMSLWILNQPSSSWICGYWSVCLTYIHLHIYSLIQRTLIEFCVLVGLLYYHYCGIRDSRFINICCWNRNLLEIAQAERQDSVRVQGEPKPQEGARNRLRKHSWVPLHLLCLLLPGDWLSHWPHVSWAHLLSSCIIVSDTWRD